MDKEDGFFFINPYTHNADGYVVESWIAVIKKKEKQNYTFHIKRKVHISGSDGLE